MEIAQAQMNLLSLFDNDKDQYEMIMAMADKMEQ